MRHLIIFAAIGAFVFLSSLAHAQQNPTTEATTARALALAGRFDEALPLAERLCAGHEADACATVAFILARPEASADDLRRAVILNGQACSQDVARACGNLGLLLNAGRGIEADVPRALILFRRSCDLGEHRICRVVGEMYRDGVGGPARLMLAEEYLDRACDQQEQAACDGLRQLRVDPDLNATARAARDAALANNSTAARPLAERSCAAGHADGCAILALLLVGGDIPDFPRALSLAEQSCERGSPSGCGYLGTMYNAGIGVTARPTRALPLLRRACDGGDYLFCLSVAVAFRDGVGVSQDLDTAVTYFTRACDYGEASGCSGETSTRELLRQEGCENLVQMADEMGRSMADLRQRRVVTQAEADEYRRLNQAARREAVRCDARDGLQANRLVNEYYHSLRLTDRTRLVD